MNTSSNQRRRRLSLAGLLALQMFAFASGASSADTEERQGARSVSPDGKWEFRLAQPEEGEDSQAVFVIAKRDTHETSVTLSEEALSPLPEKAKVVWAPDSKRFAFNYEPGLRYSAVQLFQLHGDEWRELDSPESDAARAPLERSMAAQRRELKLSPTKERRPISDGFEVRRWIDRDTALLYAFSHETFPGKNEPEQVGEDVFLTLRFDTNGDWKIVRTRLLTGSKMNKVEQEELAKMAKESEEEN